MFEEEVQRGENMLANSYANPACTVSVLGQDKGYTVKYNPMSEGITKGYIRPYIPSSVLTLIKFKQNKIMNNYC